jgi:hypothetical protein
MARNQETGDKSRSEKTTNAKKRTTAEWPESITRPRSFIHPPPLRELRASLREPVDPPISDRLRTMLRMLQKVTFSKAFCRLRTG